MRENSFFKELKLQVTRDFKVLQSDSTFPLQKPMACALMNPQMDPTMESLYNHQSTWNQPLSPEMNSSVYAAHSPQGSVHSPGSAHSPVLSHAGSPMPAAAGCCSPVSVHSPNMQAAHSPVMAGSPAENMLGSIKQEQLEAELRYCSSDSCETLSSLLRSNELIAAQNMAVAPPHMGPPHPREILDGKSKETLFYSACLWF